MFKIINEFIIKDNIVNKKYFYILFSILVLLISFTGLNGSLQNIDEMLFARISRGSLEHNSWLVQMEEGKQTFIKSPMVFWTAMISFKLFGISDFTAKIPSAIAAVITSFAILFICLKLFNSYKTGLMAVFIYLCSLQVYASSHQICTDSLFQMFLLLSLFFSIKGIKDNKLWFLLSGFLNGMVFLSKSALGFIIPSTILIYIIIQRRWNLLLYPIIVFLISLIFSAPYFLYLYIKIPEFKELFLIDYLVNVTYQKGGHEFLDILKRVSYYIALLIVFILPFTPGLIFVFYRKGEEEQPKNIIWNEYTKILLIYFLVIIIGFSLIRQKMAHYTLPMIPILAMFLGKSLSNIKSRKAYLSLFIFALIVLTVFLILYSKEASRYPTYKDVVIGLVTIYTIFIIVNAILFIKKTDGKIGLFMVVFIFFITFTIHTAITVPLDFNSDIKSFASVYKLPAPIYVISTNKVNEGNKTRATIWYMRKRSIQYNNLDHFIKDAKKVEKGAYLIFYKDYTYKINEIYNNFKVLQSGKIWNIGVVN